MLQTSKHIPAHLPGACRECRVPALNPESPARKGGEGSKSQSCSCSLHGKSAQQRAPEHLHIQGHCLAPRKPCPAQHKVWQCPADSSGCCRKSLESISLMDTLAPLPEISEAGCLQQCSGKSGLMDFQRKTRTYLGCKGGRAVLSPCELG